MSETPPHGRDSTYTNHRCRCEPCREAHRRYQAGWRTKPHDLAALQHGSYSTATNYGCGCEPCREARRVYEAAYYYRRRARAS